MKKIIAMSVFVLIAFSFADVGASPDPIGVSAQFPAISPSGQEVAFAADFDGESAIWIASIDGSSLRRVSPRSSPAGSSTEPSWSPDGRRITYASFNGAKSDIWVVSADGSNPVRLTSNGSNNSRPVWSPDGQKIAFVSDKDRTKDIWLMNSDGTQPVKLVTSSAQENSPCFSPSGEQIVFLKSDGDAASLMIVNVDGTGLRQLTTGNFRDWEPNWGARGIVFSSNRNSEDRMRIWAIQPDGSGLRQLGDVPGHDPVWLADGRILMTDESLPSKAISSIATFDPRNGTRRILVDIQGYLTPIDVRPGQSPNSINPRSMGKVQVAILSTRTFDATTSVAQQSLTFGRTGSENSLAFCLKPALDVNGDGLPDLVCSFDLRSTGFLMGDTTAILRFNDVRGVPFEGRDSIVTVNQDVPEVRKY